MVSKVECRGFDVKRIGRMNEVTAVGGKDNEMNGCYVEEEEEEEEGKGGA